MSEYQPEPFPFMPADAEHRGNEYIALYKQPPVPYPAHGPVGRPVQAVEGSIKRVIPTHEWRPASRDIDGKPRDPVAALVTTTRWAVFQEGTYEPEKVLERTGE